MGEEDSPSYLASYWSSYKAYWGERLKNFDKYKKIYSRDKPLPKWTEADVEEFVKSDPIYGPQVQLTRQGAKISAAGSLVGAVTTAGVAMKYSKNGIGTLLSFGAGAAFGWVFGKEVANHTLQLYKFDTMDAQIKFFDWWEKKTEGRS